MQPLSVTPFSLSAIPPEAWRNGGGTTRVIAAEPVDGAANRFGYRLSIADISRDGPFSTFEGVERTSLLLEGRELRLLHEDKLWRAAGLLQAIQYDGDLPLQAHIGDTPARCLNVMVRKGFAKASLKVVDADSVIAPAQMCMILSLHDGCAVTTGGTPSRHELNRYEGLLLQHAECQLNPSLPDARHQAVVVSISRHAK